MAFDNFRSRPGEAPADPLDPWMANKALEAAGSTYRVPATPAQQPQTDATPAPSIVDPYAWPDQRIVNGALAATGSSYQIPADIEDRTFNPRAGLSQLKTEHTAAQNRALGLTTEKGDIAAEGSDRSAATLGELRNERQAGRKGVEDRVAINRRDKDDLEKRMRAQLDEIERRIATPPDETVARSHAILGAAFMAAGGDDPQKSFDLFNQGVARRKEELRDMFAQRQGLFTDYVRMYGLQNEDSAAELDQEKALQTLATSEYDAALKQIAAETDSKEYRRAAEEARNKLRDGFVSEGIAAAQRQAAAGAESKYWTTPLDQLAALNAEGRLPKAGQKVLAERVKTDQATRKNEADIADKWADANKKNGAGGPSAGSEVLGGVTVTKPAVWSSLPAPVQTSFTKAAGAMPGLLATLTKLRDMYKEYGTETLPTEAKRQMEALSADALGQIKEANELGALDNGVANLVSRQIGDPTAWNLGLGNLVERGDVKIEETIRAVRNNFGRKAATYGLDVSGFSPLEQVGDRRPVAAGEPAPQPTSQAAQRIPMVNLQTGETRMVRPDLVSAYEKHGFIPNQVPAEEQPPAPVAASGYVLPMRGQQ